MPLEPRCLRRCHACRPLSVPTSDLPNGSNMHPAGSAFLCEGASEPPTLVGRGNKLSNTLPLYSRRWHQTQATTAAYTRHGKATPKPAHDSIQPLRSPDSPTRGQHGRPTRKIFLPLPPEPMLRTERPGELHGPKVSCAEGTASTLVQGGRGEVHRWFRPLAPAASVA